MSPAAADAGSSGSSSIFSVLFIAEEVDGEGDKGSGDTIAIDVQTVLVGVLNMSLGPTPFSDEDFLW